MAATPTTFPASYPPTTSSLIGAPLRPAKCTPRLPPQAGGAVKYTRLAFACLGTAPQPMNASTSTITFPFEEMTASIQNSNNDQLRDELGYLDDCLAMIVNNVKRVNEQISQLPNSVETRKKEQLKGENLYKHANAIWKEYEKALNAKTLDLDSKIAIHYFDMHLCDSILEQTRIRIIEITNRQSAFFSRIPTFTSGFSLPSGWALLKSRETIQTEALHSSNSIIVPSPITTALAPLTEEAFPILSSTCSELEKNLNNIIYIKDIFKILSQVPLSNKKNKEFIIKYYRDHLSIYQVIDIPHLTTLAEQRQQAIDEELRITQISSTPEAKEKIKLLSIEKDLLTSILNEIRFRITQLNELMAALDKIILPTDPLPTVLDSTLNTTIKACFNLLRQAVIHKERQVHIGSLSIAHDNHKTWFPQHFQHLKSEWDTVLKVRESAFRMLSTNINSLETLRGYSSDCQKRSKKHLDDIYALVEARKAWAVPTAVPARAPKEIGDGKEESPKKT